MNPIARGIRIGSWLPWVLRKIATPPLPSSSSVTEMKCCFLRHSSSFIRVSLSLSRIFVKDKKVIITFELTRLHSQKNESTYWIKVFIDLYTYLGNVINC